MQLNITFRQMETSDTVKDYVRQKVNKVKKYVPEPVTASVVLSTERFRHLCDVTIVAEGKTIKGSDSSEETLYSSIDKVMDKIERQLRDRKAR